MSERKPTTRINSYHDAKRNLLGNKAGNVPPAWRDSKDKQKEQGSKILLSMLPPDVGEPDVEELFRKTVGPLKECFLIYNTKGRSKGMAVITFQRPGDAAAARARYNGKFIDGRRPIKIEIIIDSDTDVRPAPAPVPSLLGRIGKIAGAPKTGLPAPQIQAPNRNVLPTTPQKMTIAARTVQTAATNAVVKRRKKKGPRRLNKSNINPKSLAQLDQDMEEYRAGADGQKSDQ